MCARSIKIGRKYTGYADEVISSQWESCANERLEGSLESQVAAMGQGKAEDTAAPPEYKSTGGSQAASSTVELALTA